MLSTRRVQLSTVEIDPSARKELASLTFSELAEALAASIAGDWEIEVIKEPNGDEGLVLMPASADDSDGPTLILWQHEGAYRVDELRWDRYEIVVRCLTSAEGLTEMRHRVGNQAPSYSELIIPGQATKRSAGKRMSAGSAGAISACSRIM